MKMERLSRLINDGEFWALLQAIGNHRVMEVHDNNEPFNVYFECLDDDAKIIDLTVYPADSVPAGILYRMHVKTPNGTLYESNPDNIRGDRLKDSLREIVDYYGGKNEC